MRFLGVSLMVQVAADVATDPLGGWSTLIQFGVVGLVALAFITGKFHSDSEFKAMVADRDLARADAAQVRAELAAVRQRMEEQVVPALVRMTDAMAAVERVRRTAQLR